MRLLSLPGRLVTLLRVYLLCWLRFLIRSRVNRLRILLILRVTFLGLVRLFCRLALCRVRLFGGLMMNLGIRVI